MKLHADEFLSIQTVRFGFNSPTFVTLVECLVRCRDWGESVDRDGENEWTTGLHAVPSSVSGRWASVARGWLAVGSKRQSDAASTHSRLGTVRQHRRLQRTQKSRTPRH